VHKLCEYMNDAESAKMIGGSPGTVCTWAADGKIPMHRNPTNGYQLFKRSDLEKFLRTVEASGAEPPEQKKN
jgi:predicted site-specific integrase-resolvase